MKKIAFLIGLLLVLMAMSGCKVEKESRITEKDDAVSAKAFKVLHIMSYHSPWVWTDEQLRGFKEALNYENAEYKVFQMDTKRQSTDEWKEQAGREARELIASWEPDLIYTTDDNAQIYVAKYYINSSIPFVFSGVNADPGDYGFRGSKNIAGVIEQEHFIETMNLLKKLAPKAKRIAVITDEDPTWPPIIARMKEKSSEQLTEFNFVSRDTVKTYKDYKEKIGEYQAKADAILHLGVFTFKDELGNNVPYEEVMQWTVENSAIPDISFWEDRVTYGQLASVTISPYWQGYAAGNIARGILLEKKNPSSFPFEPALKGDIVISLARANQLGIIIEPNLISNAKIIKEYAWETEQT